MAALDEIGVVSIHTYLDKLVSEMEKKDDQFSRVCAKLEAMQRELAGHIDGRLHKLAEDVARTTADATRQLADTILERVERGRLDSEAAHGPAVGNLPDHAARPREEAAAAPPPGRQPEAGDGAQDLCESVHAALRQAFNRHDSRAEARWQKMETALELLDERLSKYRNPKQQDDIDQWRSGNEKTLAELQQLLKKAKGTEDLHKENLELLQKGSAWPSSHEGLWRRHTSAQRARSEASDLDVKSVASVGNDSDVDVRDAKGRRHTDRCTDMSSDAGSIDTADLAQQVRNMVGDYESGGEYSGCTTPTGSYR
mmetsp:Transcript_101080/g.286468  ORF Transcript_101080/g.286468 Transcript_101080/m.286468 type:complete len:312 (+) Transcript_101080:141-1076(+)